MLVFMIKICRKTLYYQSKNVRVAKKLLLLMLWIKIASTVLPITRITSELKTFLATISTVT